jgi:hypothetical protein
MKNKKILFEVTHPKHFHQFKNLALSLEANNEVLFLARKKDVVIDLLKVSSFNFIEYDLFGKTIFEKVKITLKVLIKYYKVINEYKPDIVLSRSSPYSTLLSIISPFKTVIFPDSEGVMLTSHFVAPLSDYVISPLNYEKNYGKKHYRLNGLFEETYLSNKYFSPDRTVLKKLNLNLKERFFLLRFVGWNANHDVNQYGFNIDQKRQLVNSLKNYGRIFISSENALEDEFEQYRISIHPKDIHHFLYFTSLYAGDSQSMATEAALLGVPSLRFNSFVGEKDMSNFKLLEQEYKLLYNFKSPESLINKAKELLANKELSQIWKIKRENYFANSDDLNKQTSEIISTFLS